MADAHEFLKALAVVLCVAAVTTVVFQKLRQPVVLGYILAGLIVGPHLPIPLVADPQIVQTLSELGVILLMFSLGLEFSISKLVKVGPTAGVTAVVQCSIMFWLGFLIGRLFGWTFQESLYTGAIIAISSTTIIAKAFNEQKIGGHLREMVVGILIVEDLIAILLMAVLTAISTGSGLSAPDLAVTVGKLVIFLTVLMAVGLLVVPRAMRAITKLESNETTLVASIGVCFAVALLALDFGYSVALGAFLAGALVAESGQAAKIEHLVEPVRDVFAAIFFVSVGMLIVPEMLVKYWQAILVITVIVIAGKIFSVALGSLLTGESVRTSVKAGMSLAQIGEFSFIIAGLGLSLGAIDEFLYPVAVAVSALTTLTTPWLIKNSDRAANWVERKLPRPIQTFASLYGSWLEQLRKSPAKKSTGAAVRRALLLLLVDFVALAGLIIAASINYPRAMVFLTGSVGLNTHVLNILYLAASFAIGFPFALGILRVSKHLGKVLAEAALPASDKNRTDLALAPRKMLIVTLQLVVVLIVGLPLLALTQPFLPNFGVIGLGILVLALAVLFWRSAANLQGHVRAGAQVVVEALAAQTRKNPDRQSDNSLDEVHHLLPGLGTPVPVRIKKHSFAAGKSIAELNLRALTGATVLALHRGEEGKVFPTAKEVLQAGDTLALAGSAESVAAARKLLEAAAS
ncbi:MAG TPA: cation:proton antiporter [bacterium]|nr:cation:proton antiporter [bacterium]